MENSKDFREKYLKNYEKDLLPAYRIGHNETVMGTQIGGIADEDIVKDLKTIGKRQAGKLDESTISSIRDTLSGKLAEGDQTAQSLAASIKDLFTQTYKNRDLTVAKHEIFSTMAGGVLKGEQSIEKLYPDAIKIWLHGGNFDARENHKAADNRLKAKIKDPFKMPKDGGGFVLIRTPRDPNAPIEETIHCGCNVRYQLGNPKQ